MLTVVKKHDRNTNFRVVPPYNLVGISETLAVSVFRVVEASGPSISMIASHSSNRNVAPRTQHFHNIRRKTKSADSQTTGLKFIPSTTKACHLTSCIKY